MNERCIVTRICDHCGKHAPGIEYYHMDTPVYFTCHTCEPQTFEAKARQDIDSWLNGGNFQ